MNREVAFDAVVLAGGKGERLGGTDKAMLEVGGMSLLRRVLDATAAAKRVVVVGPQRAGFDDVLWAREAPVGGGPTAGIVAGLKAVQDRGSCSDWLLVLAVDQPGIASIVPILVRGAGAAKDGIDAVCPYDQGGHPQWLLAAYRAASLAGVCADVGTGHGVSVGRLVGGLSFGAVTAAPQDMGDIDTWADHQAWQKRLRA